MFWWLMNAGGLSVTQNLILSQSTPSQGPGLQSQLSRFHPIEYAQADNSYMYFATGLDPVTKWDGLTPSVVQAGVVAPTDAITLTFSGVGSITGEYQAYQRWLDVDGNVSNLSTGSAIVNTSGTGQANYSNVQVPTGEDAANVVRRQILRNAAGSFFVFFVDVDTEDLFATTFTSTKDDDTLRQQEAVALFDPSLTLNLANFNAPPPNDHPLISFYQNRLWMYGTVSYDEGMIQVTNNSKTVTGIGTNWTTAMEGRVIYVDEADRFYEIDTVDKQAQTLELVDFYKGVTSKFSTYTIQPQPNRRHLLSYSEAGKPDSWRTSLAIQVSSSDDLDDEGTALISTQSFLYLVQRRHTYRLTFFQDPTIDGGIFLNARRGCINNRCWITADGWVYMLDDRGIYRFDGSDNTDELSGPIQDLFYFDRPEGELRLNWNSSRWWHAHHDRNDSTMRWFVGLSGSRYPRHALCFNYVNPQWWIEEYPWPVTDSTLLKSINPIPLTASKYHKVFAVGIGTLDDLSGSGDTFGQVESATLNSITAPVGVSLPSSLARTPLGITNGRGKGQLRVIAEVDGQKITVTEPWMVKPDSTSTFRIGAIEWSWRGPWSQWAPSEVQQRRRITTSFQPSDENTTMDIRVYEDYATSPNVNQLSWPRNDSGASGVELTEDSPDAVVDLSQVKGWAHLTLDDLRSEDAWRRDVVSVELRGFSGSEAVRIYQVDVEGAVSRPQPSPPRQGR